jgi:hypothetical protein
LQLHDLYWLAGLLEGEGCFRAVKASGWTYAWIGLKMTDYDVVQRAAKLMDIEHITIDSKREFSLGSKPIYVVQQTGYASAELMRQLLSLMGERRSAKIREILAQIEVELPQRKWTVGARGKQRKFCTVCGDPVLSRNVTHSDCKENEVA